MAVKIYDTMTTASDGFPLAYAEKINVKRQDGSEDNLQNLFNNGELSGGGSGTSYIELSEEEYLALSDEERASEVEYRTYDTGRIFKRGIEYGKDSVQISDNETVEDKTWSSKKTSDEIAKVETELKGNIEELNNSLVDKAEIDDTSTSALDATWSASKIYSAINSIGFKGGAPENAKSATTPGVYFINRSDDAYPVRQGYLIVSKPRQDYGCILQEVYNFSANAIYSRGCWFNNWYDWQELATMGKLGGLTFSTSGTTLTITNGTNTWTLEANS